MEGNYKDPLEPYQLYVVRKASQVLYVGISESNVWNRWFSGTFSHMPINIHGEYDGITRIGIEISRDIGHLSEYRIELWTLKDCMEYCKDSLLSDKCDIHDVEPLMVQAWRPVLNMHYNNSIEYP